jgi:hypothetical protein
MDRYERPRGGDRAGIERREFAHLSRAHPLAEVAARHCAGHTTRPRRAYIGGVACGACWERAIRDDERVVVAFDLPPVLRPDPSYVDTVAVDLLCGGERVAVTPVERAEAVRRLYAAGLGAAAIAERLAMSYTTVMDTLAGLRKAIPLIPAHAHADADADAGGRTERVA